MNQPPGSPPFGGPPGAPGPFAPTSGDSSQQPQQQAWPSQQPQAQAWPQPSQQPQQQAWPPQQAPQGWGPPPSGSAQPQAFGQPQYPQQQYGQAQPGGFGAPGQLASFGEPDKKWRWHYNRMIGVMYGPIPVGVIVVAVGAAIYYANQ